MPSAPSGGRKTKHLDNQVFPQWNETFQFLYDPEETNIMSKSNLVLTHIHRIIVLISGLSECNVGFL